MLAVGSHGDEHAAGLVLQWAVAMLTGRNRQKRSLAPQPQTPDSPTGIESDGRAWRLCANAVSVPLSKSITTTLSQHASLGLLQAAVTTVFRPSTPSSAAVAAVSLVSALLGRGLPQVPADKVLELAADIVENLCLIYQRQRLQHHAQDNKSRLEQQLVANDLMSARNALCVVVLQYLVAVQRQQASQRKAFQILVGRMVQPLLTLHSHLRGVSRGGIRKREDKGQNDVRKGGFSLRQAIDAVLGELLFHREHVEALRVLLASRITTKAGANTAGGSKKRQRGSSPASAGGGEGKNEETSAWMCQGAAAAGSWTAYQGILLQALHRWANEEEDESLKESIVHSFEHLFRLFVWRLVAVNALSATAATQLSEADGGEGADGGTETRDMNAVASILGSKRKEEVVASAATSSPLVSRPSFMFGVKLWLVLVPMASPTTSGLPHATSIREAGRSAEALSPETRSYRLVAGRRVLEAMLTLNVYHYEADCSPDGQFQILKSMFSALLGREEGHGESKDRKTESAGNGVMVNMLVENLRCLATMLRIDHRLAEGQLSELVSLLTRLYAVASTSAVSIDRRKMSDEVMGGSEADEHGSLPVEGRMVGEAEQDRVSARNALRQVCVRVIVETIGTFARLRNVDLLVQAVFSMEVAQDMAVTALISCPEVASAVGSALRESPPPQLIPLWDLISKRSALFSASVLNYDSELERKTTAAGEGKEAPEMAVSLRLGRPGVRSKLLGLLLENMQVSAANAFALKGRINGILAHLRRLVLDELREGTSGEPSPGTLRGKGRRGPRDSDAIPGPSTVRVALTLYAHLLELDLLCDFWVESSDDTSRSSSSDRDTEPSSRTFSTHGSFVKAVVKHISSLVGCRKVVDMLVVSRLYQLLVEKGGPPDGWGRESALALGEHVEDKEERDLVACLFQAQPGNGDQTIGDDGNAGNRDGWQRNLAILGPSLPLWAWYCGKEHLDTFWHSIFSDSYSATRNLTSCHSRPSIRLLTDASFYEISPLACRCIPAWSFYVWESLASMRPGSTPKKGLQQLKGWMERGGVTSLAMATEYACFLSAPTSVGKTKRATSPVEKERNPFVKEWVKYTQDDSNESLARAVHLCRLLNSLPSEYLPSEQAPLRFLFSVFISCGITRNPTSTGRHILALALATSATQALQSSPQEIFPLINNSTHIFEQWFLPVVLSRSAPSLSSSSVPSSAGDEVGLSLLKNYIASFLLRPGNVPTEGGMHVNGAKGQGQEKAMTRLVSCLLKDKLLPLLEKHPGSNGSDDDSDLAHALRLIQALLAPYLSKEGMDASMEGIDGREDILNLAASRLGPAAARHLPFSASSEVFLVLADLMKLVGQNTSEGDALTPAGARRQGSFKLPSHTVLQVLKPGKTGNMCTRASSLKLVAAYLQYGMREEDFAQEGAILEAMVDFAMHVPSASKTPATAFEARQAHFLATAIENTRGGSSVQGQALHRLIDCMYAAQEAFLSRPAGRSRAAVTDTLRRACCFFERLVEAADSREGPAVEAIRLVAQDFLGLASSLVTVLMTRLLDREAPPASNLLSQSELDACLSKVLGVLRLFVRKRWLFPSGSGMRVEDVGRILAPVSALIPVMHRVGGKTGEQLDEVPPAEGPFAGICNLLSTLLKLHPRLVSQSAPPFFLVARALFRLLVVKKTSGNGPYGELGAVKAWVRLIEHIAGQATLLRKHLMMLLVDYLSVYPYLGVEDKEVLQTGAFALIDALNSSEVQHMNAALLDPVGQALLKKLYSEYQQQYKFRGKV